MEYSLRPEEAAESAGVTVRTTYKWLRRFREEGERGFLDRNSRPHHYPHDLPEATRTRIVAALTERQTYRQISRS